LVVKAEKEDMNYPSSINDKYMIIYNYIQDSTNYMNKEFAVEGIFMLKHLSIYLRIVTRLFSKKLNSNDF